MIIDTSLMDNVKKYSNDFLLNNFNKVIDELNFEDGMSGKLNYRKNSWIEVEFDNSWILTVLHYNKYWLSKYEDNDIIERSYKQLLKFMEKQGIRKSIQCEYKDSELFIVNFENEKHPELISR